MWQGFRHGMHYLNYIKLLTPRLKSITGGAYSIYQFKNDRHFSLSFELTVTGDKFSSGDGFMMSLTQQPLPAYGLNFSDEMFQINDENFTDPLSQVFLQDVR